MIAIETISSYASLIADSYRIPDPPAFHFGTFPGDVSAYYYGATHLHGMGVYLVRDVGFVRGYFLGTSNDFIYGGQVQVHPGDAEAKRGELEPVLANPARRRIPKRAAIIVGPGSGYLVYGHWIAEYLPRLAMLHLAGHDIANLVYPIPQRTPAFARDLLALAGVPSSSLLPLDENEVVQFDELLIPSSPHNGVRYAAVMKDVAAFLRAGIARSGQAMPQAKTPARLFIARAGGNRALLSRAAVEQIARDNGFTLVYPEKLGFVEQVSLFENAREIVGEYGSAFHNALFSPPGTVLCGLRGDSVHPGFLQSGFASELGHHMGYIFGRTTNSPGQYDYHIDPAEVEHAFRIVFGGPARLCLRTFAVLPPDETLPPTPAANPPSRPSKPATKTSFFARLASRFGRRPPATVAPPSVTNSHELLFGTPQLKPAQAAGPARALPVLAHQQNIGDIGSTDAGWAGQIGSGFAVEGFEILVVPGLPENCLSYAAIYPDKTASPPVPLGKFCGTRGEGKPLLGFCLHLDSAWRTRIAVTTDAQFTDATQLRNVPSDTPCQAESGAALESFRIKLALLKVDT